MPALHVPLGVGEEVLEEVVNVVAVLEVDTTVVLEELEDFDWEVVELVVEVVELVAEVVELAVEAVDVVCPALNVMAGVEVGVIGTVPSEGVAEHVVT